MTQENANTDVNFMETVTIQFAMVSLSERESKTAALMALVLRSTAWQHWSFKFTVY
jgi:hypothetical protein